MGDPQLPAGRWIEIRVEHAISAPELQLEAAPLLDLKRRPSEMLDHFMDGEAGELGRRARRRRDLNRLLCDGRILLRPRRAVGEEDEDEGE